MIFINSFAVAVVVKKLPQTMPKSKLAPILPPKPVVTVAPKSASKSPKKRPPPKAKKETVRVVELQPEKPRK